MNEEKKIAQALMDALKMRDDSYCHDSSRCTMNITDCLINTCKDQGLSSNLWALLDLGIRWENDVQLWCEDILADRDVKDSMISQEEINKTDEIEPG